MMVVVVITIGLYVYNSMLQTDIASLRADIDRNNTQVTVLNEGSNLLQVSHLLQTNSSIIEKLKRQSQIVSYINHLRTISSGYNLSITGFEYSGEQV